MCKINKCVKSCILIVYLLLLLVFSNLLGQNINLNNYFG